VKNNLFADEIIVFTPKNEFRIFPKDATPLDFAFEIHTDIGCHCIGAKVNGRVVPLDYKLESGDTIEIITSKNQKPTKEWLKCIVTQKAKSAIMKYLREDRKVFEESGKKIWDDISSKFEKKFSEQDITELFKNLKFDTVEDFYYAIGTANLDVSLINDYLHEKINDLKFKVPQQNKKVISKFNLDSITNTLRNPKVKVAYAACCNPLPGDDIVCTIKAGHEITVHRRSCGQMQFLLNTSQPSVFELDWSALSEREFTVKIKIIGEDRTTMINEITSKVLSLPKIGLRGFNFNSGNAEFNGVLTLEVANLKDLHSVFEELKSVNGVKSVDRFSD
jgi:GTP diphosphokinase / guanosine-3',5'-bis(diphosphate) 3'-diphosphatase